MCHKSIKLLTISISLAGSAAADFANMDFAYQHGTVITNQYFTNYGITISATGPQNTAIVYDSELGGSEGLLVSGQYVGGNSGDGDPDLERLSTQNNINSGWDGGNLPSNHNAGGLLIIQETAALGSVPTYQSGTSATYTSASNYNPDDNGGGGVFSFDVDEDNYFYNAFEVTLADFDAAETYSMQILGVDGSTADFSFDVFTDSNSEFYDPTIESGNNFINELPRVYFADGEAIDSFTLTFTGSGSVSNLTLFDVVPEPSSISLLALGGLTLLLRRNRS